MKERPILFNGEMVRAVLDGRKTQTRRVVKPQPKIIHALYNDASIETERIFRSGDQRIHCPYGQIGDRLWGRETWKIHSFMECKPVEFCYRADGGKMEELGCDALNYEEWYERVIIQSSDELAAMGWALNEDGIYTWTGQESPLRWRPSIHMPRWASRILLEVMDVRVERVQEIGPLVDIPREGIDCQGRSVEQMIGQFRVLWNSINEKRGFGWDVNPRVWVVEFKQIDKET